MSAYPARVRAASDRDAVYERRVDLYALRHAPRARDAAAKATIEDDASTTFSVYEGAAPEPGRDDVGPVYALGSGGPLAVPTGRVFVILAEGERPEQHAADFSAAGFEFDKEDAGAPNAAWLRPAEGGLARALGSIDALARLPGVRHVEPQMLMARVSK